jgi:hypothetical protein
MHATSISAHTPLPSSLSAHLQPCMPLASVGAALYTNVYEHSLPQRPQRSTTQVTEVKQGERGSWELSGLRKAEEGSKEVALGTFDAVILTDAMAGNPGQRGQRSTEH